ncbi:MAG: thiamine phosphate synthase [Crocinitomicaceae bacterium]|jgi:thiamine-phosphate pyrophosphorylase
MSKIIIISPESHFPNETKLVQEMLELNTDFRFHLRKPNWTLVECERFLKEISTSFHSRISIHQHFELTDPFPEIQTHLPEKKRSERKGISTSFHTEKDMMYDWEKFDYFFCSPLFPSISKNGYSTDEKWDINDCSEEIKRKAVALGGMTAKSISEARKTGFQNFAFLGEIWLSENPIETFKEIVIHAQ